MKISVNQNRLQSEIDSLAVITEAEPPVVTRVLFSEADLRGRAFVKNLCREAELKIREDAVGNIFSRWEGSKKNLPPVATGSHIDAIPNAGKYDGVVGVLGAIEAIRALKKFGFQPKRSIELIVFTSEEPTRFGIGCLGSRLLGGMLSLEKAAKLRDRDGKDLEFWRKQGGCKGVLDSVRLPRIPMPRLSSCTSSKGRFSKRKTCPSASSRKSPRQARCGSGSPAWVAMRARC